MKGGLGFSKSFYIATRIGNRPIAKELRSKLIEQGHIVTSRWIDGEGVFGATDSSAEYAKKWSDVDLYDVSRARATIVLADEDGGTGMWVEMGHALALRKPVLYVGPPTRTVFAYANLVVRFDTIEQLLEYTAK